jgi:GR25 family glycosyltransferase involved in LPS biosynthesis
MVKFNNLPVYLVSMEKDLYRRNKMNIRPDIYLGIDGNSIDNDSNLKKGEIGCYTSHITLLNYSIINRKNSKIALIMEDDAVVVNKNCEKIVNKMIKCLPKDWEILCIGHNYYETSGEAYVSCDEYTMKCVNYLHGCQGYIVNLENTTLNTKVNILHRNMNKPYDVILPTVCKTYILEPKLVELNECSNTSNTQFL